MRAAIMRGSRIVTGEIDELVPGPGQVLVRTDACGICGSDLHTMKFPQAMSDIYRASGIDNPMNAAADVVFGHEFAASILAYGPDTKQTLPIGTLVTSIPRLVDVSGAHVVGYSNRFPGGYAERMLLTEAHLLAVPDGVSAEEASLTEPFAVGEHAVGVADLENATAAMVVGCGPVGLAVIAALKARGFGPIIAADFAAGRRALAQRIGADQVIDPAQGSPHAVWAALGVPQNRVERARAASRGKVGRAVIFECVGVPGIIQSILEGAPAASQIVVVGVCMETDRFEPGLAIAKEVDLRFVLGYSAAEFERTLGNIAARKFDAGAIITGRIGLDEVDAAFTALATPNEQAKIVIEPGRK
jgi:threonine dehydrogenase-like Zn-dependent dehydrogenase